MNKRSQNGFTLMETLLSIAVVAVLLSTFLAVFGPATNTIRRAISVQDADRLSSALQKEMTTLRQDELGQYSTAFDKAFDWISNSASLDSSVVLFNYRGDISRITDGKMEPYTEVDGEPGRDYLVQPAVRRLGDSSDLEDLMEAVEGKVFVVSMSQLIRDESTGGLITANPGDPIVSSSGASASDAESFEDAAIAFQTDFYLLPSNSFQYLSGPLSNGGTDFEQTLGTPIHTQPMAVRR